MKLFRLEIVIPITYTFVAEGAQTTDERRMATGEAGPQKTLSCIGCF